MKIILCGEAYVGKSSLLTRYIENKFIEKYTPTRGTDFKKKEVNVDLLIEGKSLKDPYIEKLRGNGFTISFWDIGSIQEIYTTRGYHFMEANGAMVIFDITNKKSFDNLDWWITELIDYRGDIPLIIVGNKLDKNSEREVNKVTAMEKANQLGVDYIETSAKSDCNVNKVFLSLTKQIFLAFIYKPLLWGEKYEENKQRKPEYKLSSKKLKKSIKPVLPVVDCKRCGKSLANRYRYSLLMEEYVDCPNCGRLIKSRFNPEVRFAYLKEIETFFHDQREEFWKWIRE
ncbi:MAG: GTP-binding protein [Promethearchaeota archaeon]